MKKSSKRASLFVIALASVMVSTLGGARAEIRSGIYCVNNTKAVQAIYAYTPDRAGRYTSTVYSQIRDAMIKADYIFNASASETGTNRHVVFKVNFRSDGTCYFSPTKVALQNNTDDDSHTNVMAALKRLGFTSTNRIYLVFVERDSGICHSSGPEYDARKVVDNANNIGPAFSMLARDCWHGPAAAHELAHSMGAVQKNAPFSTNMGHTYQNDSLSKGPEVNSSNLRRDCADVPEGSYRDWRLDCGHDTYFYAGFPPNTSKYSWIRSNFNVANDSLFLFGPPNSGLNWR